MDKRYHDFSWLYTLSSVSLLGMNRAGSSISPQQQILEFILLVFGCLGVGLVGLEGILGTTGVLFQKWQKILRYSSDKSFSVLLHAKKQLQWITVTA